MLNELNNPSTDTANAIRVNRFTHNSGTSSYTIRVPIEYGELLTIYQNDAPLTAYASLDRSAVPDSLRIDLAGDFRWPSSIDHGFVDYVEGASQPTFGRGVTDSERSDIANLVSSEKNRDDNPGRLYLILGIGFVFAIAFVGWVRERRESV